MAAKYMFILLLAIPATVLAKDYFTAAVFEHRPRGIDKEGKQEVIENLKYYEKAATIASKKGADIILFNEYGLFTYRNRTLIKKYMEHIPDPNKKKFNPCNEKNEDLFVLSTFSCMAKKNNMYVVANMGDIHPCEGSCDANKIEECNENCPEDGVFIYNTDVAFDRKGNLVARYHKMHPYFENVNVPDEPEFPTFKTDFGTFGMIVCFDSVWEKATILAKHFGIDTLLFPTYWFDDIVPLNGVEWQQSWAIANRVNFIAANSQTPGNGTLGSGIYSKDLGALVYTYEPDGESKLLTANVPFKKSNVQPNPSITVINLDSVSPKVETGDAFVEEGYNLFAGPTKDHYLDYRYFKHQTENYTLVKLEKTSGDIESCNNGFCCNLNYVANDMNEDFYFGSFSGLNNVRNYYHWCEEVCMLVRCDPFESKPCVLLSSRSSTVFKSLKISAKFVSERVYPTVSLNKKRLAPKSEWNYKRSGHKSTLKFETKSSEPLLKAALFGRCYSRDPEFVPWFRSHKIRSHLELSLEK